MARTHDALLKKEREDRGDLSHELLVKIETNATSLFGIFDQIRLSNPADPKQIILFTACHQGDGVSTICFNSALTLSKQGKKVLLIDANLHAPILHRQFGLPREKGFTDVMRNNCSFEESIQETRIPSIWLLAAGKRMQDISGCFIAGCLKTLFENLRKEYEYILIDSAPITPVSETVFLASASDGAILILRSGETRWEVAKAAKTHLERNCKAGILGAALNHKRYHIPSAVYNLL